MSTLTLQLENANHLERFIQLAEQLKVPFKVKRKKSQEQFFSELKEGLDWVAAHQRGEIPDNEIQDIYELLAELHQIAAEAQ